MTKTRTSRKWPILISFVLFLALLLGTFSLQLKSALDGFDRWVEHEDHRLPNILQVHSTCRWPVLNRFMDLQPLAEADAFVLGDSQIFARGAKQEELFYTHWLGPEATVINFSYFGGPIGDMHQIAEALKARGHKARFSYTAINLTHFTTSIYAAEISKIPSDQDGVLPRKPNGFTSLFSNRYICAFRYRKDFAKDRLRTPRYRKLTGDFKKTPMPDGYVNFREDSFQTVTNHYFKDYPNIAETMIIASAPIAYDKFSLYDYDPARIDSYNKVYAEFCADIKAPLVCLDLITKISSDGFGDLIHLNARGHKTLGENLRRYFP